jgi:hypothetical protein
MSGGHFNYDQFRIGDIADEIQEELDNQGKKKEGEDLWGTRDYYEKYPEEKFYPVHPDDVQQKFKEAVRALRMAKIYTHRIDWYLSGDDGEESFIKRLAEDVREFNREGSTSS